MLANQLLRSHKVHLFQLKQFLPDDSKYHLYLKKGSLLNVYLMRWTFIPPKIQKYSIFYKRGVYSTTKRKSFAKQFFFIVL